MLISILKEWYKPWERSLGYKSQCELVIAKGTVLGKHQDNVVYDSACVPVLSVLAHSISAHPAKI